MPLLIYFIVSALAVTLISLARSRRMAEWGGSLFYGVQLAAAVCILPLSFDTTILKFFTFDATGCLFFGLMALISGLSFIHSNYYLDSESLREYKIYNVSLLVLCVSASCVYLSNNLAVTWIFLEATTLSAAGLVYHRRNRKSLEATWKYIFVCSTGIAMAYLGILLLSTIARDGDLTYHNLSAVISGGDPLYLKIASLFILVGYSCKLEIFPLYKIGADANFAAPTPASAVISTVIVNCGFVAILRVMGVIQNTPVWSWISDVMIIAGVFSLLISAFYIRRTNNYKRFLAYSTVENAGIAIIGIGVGGFGIFAAVFHIVFHSLLKSGMFFQLAQIGKIYGSYRINRIGDYIRTNKTGALGVMLGTIGLLALPPSALFVSEVLLFKQIIADGSWWLMIVMLLMFCIIMYSFMGRILRLCYNRSGAHTADPLKIHPFITWSSIALILLSMILGVTQPDFLVEFINSMI